MEAMKCIEGCSGSECNRATSIKAFQIFESVWNFSCFDSSCLSNPKSKSTLKQQALPALNLICSRSSAVVQQCLMTSSVWEAIEAIDSMAKLDAGLSSSSCFHLRRFLRETLSFWHKIVKERLTRWSTRSTPSLHLDTGAFLQPFKPLPFSTL